MSTQRKKKKKKSSQLETAEQERKERFRKLVGAAIRNVKGDTFYLSSATQFKVEVKRCPHSESMDLDDVMAGLSLLENAFQEGCEHFYAGLRFFYTVLLLTREDSVVRIPTHPGDDKVDMPKPYRRIHSRLWQGVEISAVNQSSQEQEDLLTLLEELRIECMTEYEQNPSVCYLVCEQLETSYALLDLEDAHRQQLLACVLLLRAKCAILKKRYDLGEIAARQAVHHYSGDNTEANSLLAKASRENLKQSENDASQTKGNHKRNSAVKSKTSSLTTGSGRAENVSRNLQETGPASHVDPCSESEVASAESFENDTTSLHDTCSLISDLDTVSEFDIASVMSELADTEDEEGEQIEEAAEEDLKEEESQSWYQMSQEKYSKGEEPDKIVAGEELEVNHYLKNEISGNVKYNTIGDPEVLEQMLRAYPLRYKRCRIKLDGPYKAICTVLDVNEKHTQVIEIHGRKSCGRTFNEDEVVVEIIEKGNDVLEKDRDITFGKVIGVLKSNFRESKYPILACHANPRLSYVMNPICNSVPQFYIWTGRTRKNYPGEKYKIDVYKYGTDKILTFDRHFDILPEQRGQYMFLVVFVIWDPHFVYPKGAVVKILDAGRSFTKGVNLLEEQFAVPRYYDRDTVTLVEQLMSSPDVRSVSDHMDLRELTVFTIDPPLSKDLDDALSVWKKDGCLVVGVHITDVASLVRKDDAVDKEACKRKTSFYASSRRKYHMLPEPLSEDRLSLIQGRERFAISVLFTMDKKGNHFETKGPLRSIIRVCKNLTYEEAQAIIDGGNTEHSQNLVSSIRTMNTISKRLRKERYKRSRLSTPLKDFRLFYSVPEIDANDAHNLVEEFMTLANIFVAKWLMETNSCPLPLRCQSPPDSEKLSSWIEKGGFTLDLLVRLQDRKIQPGLTLDVEKQCELNLTEKTKYVTVERTVWNDIKSAAEGGQFSTLRNLMCCDKMHPSQALALDGWLDMQEPAVYRSSCSPNGTLGHYTQEISPYTHFTSPLRRYVDLIVHRQIHAVLDQEPLPYASNEIEVLSKRTTALMKRGSAFEKNCKLTRKGVKLFFKPITFSVVVTRVDENEAKFFIAAMNDLPEVSRVLSFKLLDCCKRPEADPEGTSVTCFWSKRLYRYEKLSIRRQKEQNALCRPVVEREQHLDSTMHMEFIPSHEFARTLRGVFIETEKRKPSTRHVNVPFVDEQCPLKETGVRKLSSEKCGDLQIRHHCKFSMKFFPGQILKVQMHAKADRGVTTPYVQLFHLCNNLSLCLAHTKDPVGTFAYYVETNIRQHTFSSIEEYQQLWLPIVAMETAKSSVGGEATIALENVNVKLVKAGRRFLGTFELDARFCDFRQIEVGGKSTDRLETMSRGENAFLKLMKGSLDYICLKYFPTDFDLNSTFSDASAWVGHALVKKVKQRQKASIVSRAKKPKKTEKTDEDNYGGPVVITFELRSNSLRPPEHLLEHSFTATVEIILKSEVDRRTEQMLRVIDTQGTPLAHSIALSRTPPPFAGPRFCLCINSATDLSQSERQTPDVQIPRNNPSQDAAIRKALEHPFSLIQGPPGTGKTSTGVKLVFLFHKINKTLRENGFASQKAQILFCGPSNKSVDLVARYMKNKLGSLCPKILRLYGKTIENQDFPVPKRDLISDRSLRGLASDPDIRDVTAHFIVREDGKPHAEELRTYDKEFKKYFANPEKVDISLGTLKAYNSLLAKAEQEELKKCDVILCTCAVSGSMKLASCTNISQCIIDESAMCTEPLTMIPIIARQPDQVVLLGDHKQLRPIIQCREAVELGLDQSLFERYSCQVRPLDTQYRMHKKICQFPAEQFYSWGLKTGPDRASLASWYIPPGQELSIWPMRDNPKAFCHVEGLEETLTVATAEGNEQSKSNSKEAEKVVDAFLYLLERENIPLEEINLMTQYNAQRFIIQQKLKERLKVKKGSARRSRLRIDSVRIQTVVASQGGEWDYVIFSTVRSLPRYRIEEEPTRGWCTHNLGFITDQNQINVALTRARKGLIIIGNSHLLKCDQMWRKLIMEYKKEKCFTFGDEFPGQELLYRRQSSS